MGDRVVPAFCCLIFALIAGGAQAQTTSDATDGKRVQVLQIKGGPPLKRLRSRNRNRHPHITKRLCTGITSVKPKHQQLKRHRLHRTTFQRLLLNKLEHLRLVTA